MRKSRCSVTLGRREIGTKVNRLPLPAPTGSRPGTAWCAARGYGGRFLKYLQTAFAAAVVITSLIGAPAHAVGGVNVRPDVPAIDLTDAVERQTSDGDSIQVSTAPGADGIIRRIKVPARE